MRECLAAVERPVELALVLGPEETPLPGAREIDFSGRTRTLLEELVGLCDRLSLSVHQAPGFDAERFPAICVLPSGEDVGIRYYGLPLGYELTSIAGACLEAGGGGAGLRPESVQALQSLERDVTVDVFVTPTCPHCPRAVLLAYRAALASPRVRSSAIEVTEFPGLADKRDVRAVPKVAIDGIPPYEGNVPEPVFVERLLAAGATPEPSTAV